MSCKIQRIQLHPPRIGTGVEMEAIDFHDDHWLLRFGCYGERCDAIASTQDIQEIVSVLSAMLLENEQEMAVISGDFENESKDDVLRDEAWYDTIYYVEES